MKWSTYIILLPKYFWFFPESHLSTCIQKSVCFSIQYLLHFLFYLLTFSWIKSASFNWFPPGSTTSNCYISVSNLHCYVTLLKLSALHDTVEHCISPKHFSSSVVVLILLKAYSGALYTFLNLHAFPELQETSAFLITLIFSNHIFFHKYI